MTELTPSDKWTADELQKAMNVIAADIPLLQFLIYSGLSAPLHVLGVVGVSGLEAFAVDTQISPENEAELAKALDSYCGIAVPVFTKWITEQGEDNIAEMLRTELSVVSEQLGSADTPRALKVREQIAVTTIAGELAIKAGVLPWVGGSALKVCKQVFAEWREANPSLSKVTH